MVSKGMIRVCWRWADFNKGNAHFSFMELNNMEIVSLIEDWTWKHI